MMRVALRIVCTQLDNQALGVHAEECFVEIGVVRGQFAGRNTTKLCMHTTHSIYIVRFTRRDVTSSPGKENQGRAFEHFDAFASSEMRRP